MTKKKIDLFNTNFHSIISRMITFNINYLSVTLHMYFSVSLNTMIIKDTYFVTYHDYKIKLSLELANL